MSEWWSYRVEDFVLFSARTWWRLIELHNAAWWPAQWLALGAGLAIVALAVAAWRVPAPSALARHAAPLALLLLAAAWGLAGVGFHALRHVTINWLAPWFAAVFVLQALLLAGAAWRAWHAPRPGRPRPAVVQSVAGLVLMAAALSAPLAAPALGRPWAQAQSFALFPDPTALFTLGLLLALPAASRWWLWPLPLLALVVSAAMSSAMR